MREEFSFSDGLFNAQDETKVPRNRAWAMQNATTLNNTLEGGPRYELLGARTGAHASDIGYGFGYGKFSNNEVQRITITGTPTGGNFTITFSGQTTGNIAYNADATAVLTALEALSNISIGDVSTSGGPFPGQPVDVLFAGQYANTDVALMTTSDSFTGGSSPASAVAERIKGGENEVYLAAIKNNGDSTVTMYKVDVSTGVYTSVATGLTASDWFFEQYQDKIWAVNATDGLNFYRIGGSWNDGAGTSRPNAPVVPPTFTYDLNPGFIDFSTGWTFGQTGLAGSPTIAGTVDGIRVIADTALTVGTVFTLTATNSGTVDYSHNDSYGTSCFGSPDSGEARIVPGTLGLTLINNTPVTLNPLVEDHIPSNTSANDRVYSQFANLTRTLRVTTKKVVIKLTVSAWPSGKQLFFTVRKGNVWMNDKIPFPFDANPSPVPTIAAIRYAYTYRNETTQVESALSDDGLTDAFPGNWLGAWCTLTLRGSSELTTSDRIYVYRREAGTGVWRRLPTNASNLTTWGSANVTSGTTTFVDKWMEEELKDFPSYESAGFTNSRTTLAGLVIGFWKQCLAVGSNLKLWLSFVGIPNRFAPSPDDKASVIQFNQQNINNPDVGRTVYLSDNRAEDVYGIAGQDSLYAISPYSSYAIVGDSPLESSPPRRLPGSRGAVGKRAFYRFKGGVHVGSEDGLYYYAVGRGFSGEDNGALTSREETEEVRRSWITTLLGSSYSGLAIVEHQDEVWIFNGTKYLRNNRNRKWEEGTFTDSVLALISVRSLGLRFMDSKGRIFTISDEHTDDNGTAVSWSYETGILEGPSVRVENLEIQAIGTPSVTVRVYSPFGDKSDAYGRYEEKRFDVESGRVQLTPVVLESGHRHKFLFSGVCGRDKITGFAVEASGTGKIYGK